MPTTADRATKKARSDEFKAAWKEAFPVSRFGTLEEMAQFLDSPWPSVRGVMLRAVGKRHMVEGVPLLIEAAERESDDSVRLSIALSLRDLEDPRAIETLWSMAKSDSAREPGAEMAALQGLCRLGDDRAIPIALSWYHSDGASLTERTKRQVAVFDLVLLRSSSGNRAVADLLASETNWRRRRMIRRAIRKANRWLARRS
jgi:HEAT repeat protein